MTVKKGIGYALIWGMILGVLYIYSLMHGWLNVFKALGVIALLCGFLFLILWLICSDEIDNRQSDNQN
jgi:hypothetical protein